MSTATATTRSSGRCWPLVFLLVPLLPGCSSINGLAGALAGAATGAASGNPVVGVAVGISVRAATGYALQKQALATQTNRQDRLAELAGTLHAGERRGWRLRRAWPFGDETGLIEVVSEIDTSLARCKEVLFSLTDRDAEARIRERFITQICQQPDGHWRWAGAEPAVPRWGTLQ
jgi:hypothetical protein